MPLGMEEAAPTPVPPMPSATWEAMPTPTPAPMTTGAVQVTTALAPLSGFKRAELDPEYWPSKAIGDEYVATGPDVEVYLQNIATGERHQLTDD